MSSNYGHLWSVGKPGIPGVSKNEEMVSITYFHGIDNIHVTPQNVEARVKSWLTFL